MDREYLEELFAGFGPVTIRRMFSGFGISADGINFALALRSGLYLRADEASFAKFEAAGSKPFSYETRARSMTVRSYWQVPAHLFDDSDEFTLWACEAFGAAQTAALAKRMKQRATSRKGREPSTGRKEGPAGKAGVSRKTAPKRSGSEKTPTRKTSAEKTPAKPKKAKAAKATGKAATPRARASGASSSRRG
ncbi:TfoX/Sxy family protein [Bradyrhizobium sp. SRS-191]|uniref:TfoX/Sxy family protein n=1 Tax=Bradyrhizobium sp. SRS-191 TaxID=2962606 RepID=UPI00211DB382|nr:TfoX/Sxy family protein [Bradyrhizobium sp. SRS-191]